MDAEDENDPRQNILNLEWVGRNEIRLQEVMEFANILSQASPSTVVPTASDQRSGPQHPFGTEYVATTHTDNQPFFADHASRDDKPPMLPPPPKIRGSKAPSGVGMSTSTTPTVNAPYRPQQDPAVKDALPPKPSASAAESTSSKAQTANLPPAPARTTPPLPPPGATLTRDALFLQQALHKLQEYENNRRFEMYNEQADRWLALQTDFIHHPVRSAAAFNKLPTSPQQQHIVITQPKLTYEERKEHMERERNARLKAAQQTERDMLGIVDIQAQKSARKSARLSARVSARSVRSEDLDLGDEDEDDISGVVSVEELNVSNRREELEKDRRQAIQRSRELEARQRARSGLQNDLVQLAQKEAEIKQREAELAKREQTLAMQEKEAMLRRRAEESEWAKERTDFYRKLREGTVTTEDQLRIRELAEREKYRRLLERESVLAQQREQREREWEVHREKARVEIERERALLLQQQQMAREQRNTLRDQQMRDRERAELMELQRKNDAILKLQSVGRGHMSRVLTIKSMAEYRRRYRAASRIQALARGVQAREMVAFWRPTWEAERRVYLLYVERGDLSNAESRARIAMVRIEQLLRDELLTLCGKHRVEVNLRIQRHNLEREETEERRMRIARLQREMWTYLMEEEKRERRVIVSQFAYYEFCDSALKLEAKEVFSRNMIKEAEADARSAVHYEIRQMRWVALMDWEREAMVVKLMYDRKKLGQELFDAWSADYSTLVRQFRREIPMVYERVNDRLVYLMRQMPGQELAARRLISEEERDALTALQKMKSEHYKATLDKIAYLQQREPQLMSQRVKAAGKIQRIWRGFVARRSLVLRRVVLAESNWRRQIVKQELVARISFFPVNILLNSLAIDEEEVRRGLKLLESEKRELLAINERKQREFRLAAMWRQMERDAALAYAKQQNKVFPSTTTSAATNLNDTKPSTKPTSSGTVAPASSKPSTGTPPTSLPSTIVAPQTRQPAPSRDPPLTVQTLKDRRRQAEELEEELRMRKLEAHGAGFITTNTFMHPAAPSIGPFYPNPNIFTPSYTGYPPTLAPLGANPAAPKRHRLSDPAFRGGGGGLGNKATWLESQADEMRMANRARQKELHFGDIMARRAKQRQLARSVPAPSHLLNEDDNYNHPDVEHQMMYEMSSLKQDIQFPPNFYQQQQQPSMPFYPPAMGSTGSVGRVSLPPLRGTGGFNSTF